MSTTAKTMTGVNAVKDPADEEPHGRAGRALRPVFERQPEHQPADHEEHHQCAVCGEGHRTRPTEPVLERVRVGATGRPA